MQNNRRHNCRHIDLLWAIHFTMALCGGFLGSYALFSRQLVFGSAQTANLMELVSAICGRNLPEVLIRLGALALYGWGAALSVILTRKTPLNIRYASILMTGMAVFASAFIPTAVNPVIALYPVFFVTAFQWCAFTGADGFASSTIFSTNNVKQTVLGFTEYCLEKDPERRAFQAGKPGFSGAPSCSSTPASPWNIWPFRCSLCGRSGCASCLWQPDSCWCRQTKAGRGRRQKPSRRKRRIRAPEPEGESPHLFQIKIIVKRTDKRIRKRLIPAFSLHHQHLICENLPFQRNIIHIGHRPELHAGIPHKAVFMLIHRKPAARLQIGRAADIFHGISHFSRICSLSVFSVGVPVNSSMGSVSRSFSGIFSYFDSGSFFGTCRQSSSSNSR